MDETRFDENRFKVLCTLRSAAWENFDRRRDTEWKVAIGVWTALSALIGILLTKEPGAHGLIRAIPVAGAIVPAAILFWLHVGYIKGLNAAQKLDSELFHLCDQVLNRIVEPEFASLPEGERERWRNLKVERNNKSLEEKHWWDNYSHFFQAAVTLVLSLCFGTVVFAFFSR